MGCFSEEDGWEMCRVPFSFPVLGGNGRAVLAVDAGDDRAVRLAAESLAGDITLVTDKPARVFVIEGGVFSGAQELAVNAADTLILAGTLKNEWIAGLVRDRKVDIGGIAGKWECYHLQVLDRPVYGFSRVLVIAGSDRRGAVYGIYKVSELLGVSPWVWWADSVPKKQEAPALSIPTMDSKEPSVRYRGFFINDENPSFLNWCNQKFGGVNAKVYAKVFELLLRLKGNYLWPAMWGKSFNEDDPACPALADDYGVVMGTSHHEPMMRAQKEWTDHGEEYGGHANWNYATNREGLYRFWEDRIRANKDYEKVITVGMRGDGDEEMVKDGRPEDCIRLLEEIVADQREIIAKHIDPDPAKVPQVWCLYKEVEELYYAGLNVPEDVTLMLCDDNFGNVRKLPDDGMRSHPGGFGMYYHLDYVGGPYSYKWINNMPLEKIWEQMGMAYDYGVRQIWMVNVGDIKPMEIPLSYFLDLAYDFDYWSWMGENDRTEEYLRSFVRREFGGFYQENEELPKEEWENCIYGALQGYMHLNGICKPETLRQDTFSLVNEREADRMLEDYEGALMLAELAEQALAPEKKDAYYQLVLYPVRASCIVYRLIIGAAKCNYYAGLGASACRKYGEIARQAFADDAAEAEYYNHVLSGGKWDGMMDQAHIGQTSWQSAEENIMPELAECELPEKGGLLVTVSNDEKGYQNGEAALPAFSQAVGERNCYKAMKTGNLSWVYEPLYYEIRLLNTGKRPYACMVKADEGIYLTRKTGYGCLMSEEGFGRGGMLLVEDEVVLAVRVEFTKVKHKSFIVITQAAQDGDEDYSGGVNRVKVCVTAFSRNATPEYEALFDAVLENESLFSDELGYVAIAADAYRDGGNGERFRYCSSEDYTAIPNYGRDGVAVKCVDHNAQDCVIQENIPPRSLIGGRTPGVDAPLAQYYIYLKESSDVTVTAYTAPTNQLSGHTGMRYATSIDDGEHVFADAFPAGTPVGCGPVWEWGVIENVRRTTTVHKNVPAGRHSLCFHMVDDGLVLEKLVVETTGKAPKSNLGPQCM